MTRRVRAVLPAALCITLAIGGCNVIRPRGEVLTTPDSECLSAPRSAVDNLGDTARSAGDRSGAWLVLRPEPYEPGASARRAIAIGVDGTVKEGTWGRAGDSLFVVVTDGLTGAALKLRAERGMYRGAGAGISDVLVLADSVYRPSTRRWHAELRQAPCREVPRMEPEPPSEPEPRLAQALVLHATRHGLQRD